MHIQVNHVLNMCQSNAESQNISHKKKFLQITVKNKWKFHELFINVFFLGGIQCQSSTSRYTIHESPMNVCGTIFLLNAYRNVLSMMFTSTKYREHLMQAIIIARLYGIHHHHQAMAINRQSAPSTVHRHRVQATQHKDLTSLKAHLKTMKRVTQAKKVPSNQKNELPTYNVSYYILLDSSISLVLAIVWRP